MKCGIQIVTPEMNAALVERTYNTTGTVDRDIKR